MNKIQVSKFCLEKIKPSSRVLPTKKNSNIYKQYISTNKSHPVTNNPKLLLYMGHSYLFNPSPSLTTPIPCGAPGIVHCSSLLCQACLQTSTCHKQGLIFKYCIFMLLYINKLVRKKYLVEILLCHCSFLPLKVWLVVGCVATASHLSPCGRQLKLSLPWAPWCPVVSLPEVCLLSKHLLQEGAAGSSPQVLPTAEPTYLGGPPPGSLPWAEDRPCRQHPPGVNFHSPPGGEC